MLAENDKQADDPMHHQAQCPAWGKCGLSFYIILGFYVLKHRISQSKALYWEKEEYVH